MVDWGSMIGRGMHNRSSMVGRGSMVDWSMNNGGMVSRGSMNNRSMVGRSSMNNRGVIGRGSMNHRFDSIIMSFTFISDLGNVSRISISSVIGHNLGPAVGKGDTVRS